MSSTINFHSKKYLNEIQAGELCQIGRRTMQQYRWRKIGPPYIKLGSPISGKGRILYDYDDVVDWMEHQKIKTGEDK